MTRACNGAGLRRFTQKALVNVEGLEARIDSPAWSMMAWIQLPVGGTANIIRKPLGKEKQHVCWSWKVGMPNTSFAFGGHDFRGHDSEIQVTW